MDSNQTSGQLVHVQIASDRMAPWVPVFQIHWRTSFHSAVCKCGVEEISSFFLRCMRLFHCCGRGDLMLVLLQELWFKTALQGVCVKYVQLSFILGFRSPKEAWSNTCVLSQALCSGFLMSWPLS